MAHASTAELIENLEVVLERIPLEHRGIWMIACLVAATIIQWLPTAAGCGFLCDAFENGGGKFSYELPDITGYEPQRL